MAKLIGGLGTSHIPAIGGAIHKGLQQDPYWKPFFDGFPPIRDWLGEKKPDVVVMFYNDHGLNFFLDKMPTFAVGAAPEYNNADEGWGIPTLPPLKGELDLSWHIINTLVEKEFDIVTCQEMLVDHACTLPLKLFWPEGDCPVTVVPICINTVQFPLPKPGRGLCPGQGRGRGHQVLGQQQDGGGDCLGRPEPPARRRARRLHQQGIRPSVLGQPGIQPGVDHAVQRA